MCAFSPLCSRFFLLVEGGVRATRFVELSMVLSRSESESEFKSESVSNSSSVSSSSPESCNPSRSSRMSSPSLPSSEDCCVLAWMSSKLSLELLSPSLKFSSWTASRAMMIRDFFGTIGLIAGF